MSCVVVHHRRHQRALRKTATASCADSVQFLRKKNAPSPLYFGFSTDRKAERANTDQAVCAICLVDRDLLLCTSGH